MGSLSNLVEAVEHAVAALNAAVTESGFDITVADPELHESAIALQKAKSALEIGACRVLQRWDARHVWAPGGHRSAASRLARDTHMSASTAHRTLRRARALSSVPVTASAVVSGDLSVDQLDLLARVNTPARAVVFAEHEPALVAECTRLRWADTVRVVNY